MKNIISIKNDIAPLLKLGLPLAITGLVQSATWFFETLFLAHVNQEVLAAGALVSWLFGTMFVILYGLMSSINILVAHKHGANDKNSIALITKDGLLLAVLICIPAFFLFWNIAPVFLLFGQAPSVVVLADSYLHALAWGIPATVISIAYLEVIMGLGHTRTILMFSIFTVAINILASYIFIFGKFGFPALGIAGAGWGMTFSYWITVFALFIFVLINEKYRLYFSKIFTFEKPTYLSELLQVGLPMGLMYCVEVGFFFAMTLVMGTFGSIYLAANQIALQYLGLFMSMIFSIAQAITVRMGHLLGANDFLSAERAAYAGIFISAGLLCLIALVYWSLPEMLIALDLDIHDSKNFEIILIIKKFLFVSALFQIFEAARIGFFGALRGIKDTKFTLLTSIISFWCIALPIGYLLATHITRVGPSGLWWGLVLGAFLSVLVLNFRFRYKFKESRNLNLAN